MWTLHYQSMPLGNLSHNLFCQAAPNILRFKSRCYSFSPSGSLTSILISSINRVNNISILSSLSLSLPRSQLRAIILLLHRLLCRQLTGVSFMQEALITPMENKIPIYPQTLHFISGLFFFYFILFLRSVSQKKQLVRVLSSPGMKVSGVRDRQRCWINTHTHFNVVLNVKVVHFQYVHDSLRST